MSSGQPWRLRRVVLGLVALALVLAVFGALVPRWKQAHAEAAFKDQCRTIAAESAARNATVTGDGRMRVTVLGDSYAEGYLLRSPARSWPSRLARPLNASVTVRSLGGTGFVANPCSTDGGYPARATAVPATHPDLVIVEGGLNDVLAPGPAIEAGLRATLAELAPFRVVVVGPPDAPKWHREAGRVDRVLARAAHRAGVQYVSTYRWPLSFAVDGIHLTEASHRTFGDWIAEAVVR